MWILRFTYLSCLSCTSQEAFLLLERQLPSPVSPSRVHAAAASAAPPATRIQQLLEAVKKM